ncbi:hypothetical protein KRR23_04850 [Pseudomonas sp. CVAP|uniref:hypothetical protein n=1 Tax=Pseudomonas sp. CVAP\|nr:hypothetical protein [Pseudomonas sp. CVAP\
MSKLRCKCGHVIVDQADSLPYKAGLLRDEAENIYWDEFHREIKNFVAAAESGDLTALMANVCREVPWIHASDYLLDRLTSIHARQLTTVYECKGCGRLWLDKEAGTRFIPYAPEDDGYRAILSIAPGESDNRD